MTQAADPDRRAWLGAAALAPFGLEAGAQPAPAPAATLPRMARGLNLSHWFEYERGQGLTAAEMRQLRRLGLDHVRLPVDPVVGGWHPQRGGSLNFLGELLGAVDMAVDAGLEVVVDLHLEPADKQLIEDQTETERELLRLWQTLARPLASRPREKVALELFNEPQYYGLKRWRWPVLQRRLLETVRAQAPGHLVLLSGSRGGGFEALSGLSPVADAAVAYVFHHYEPFLFTHQGAEWQDERYTTAGLRQGLRYPPDAAHDSALPVRKPRSTGAQARDVEARAVQELADHLKAGWGPQRLRAEMDRAGRWARERGVRVVCNEFGCIRANVDPVSRYRWIHDVRSALEANGIGWTLWDYTDIFGITAQSAQPGQQGRRSLDELAYGALGLARVAAASNVMGVGR
jgi:endoglucanase